MEKPTFQVPKVNNVKVIENKGPWDTKSGGKLNVLFGIDFNTLNEGYFSYEKSELDKIPQDIRGFRSYSVSDLKIGKVGANEWHRIRNELVFAIEGSVEWTCEDVYGNQASFILDDKQGVWTPPFILHTYKTLEDKNGILVIANTLFDPDNNNTHDSYSIEDFRKFQSLY
jgi:dTDP-4-dehydrorhamnose 3,5-epimerase-like enzyme